MEDKYIFSDLKTKVLRLIERVCKPDEKIHINYILISKKDGDQKTVHTDFFLPEGCMALNLVENTCVEVIEKPSYISYKHLVSLFYTSAKQILLISNHPFLFPLNRIPYSDARTKILQWSFEELEDRCREGIGKHDASNKNYLLDLVSLLKKRSSDFNQESTKASEEKEKVLESKIVNESPEELAKNAFRNGNITLFLGAGVSKDAGLPEWNSLLKALLKHDDQQPLDEKDYPGIGVASFNSLIVAARYLLAPFTNVKESDAINLLHGALYGFYDPSNESELINAIVDVCNVKDANNVRKVSSIVTLNYDDLVEEALLNKNIICQSIYNEGLYEHGRLPIIHVHGILHRTKPNRVLPILSEDTYHNLYKNAYSWSNIEILHAFYRHTCIFIGLSMSDPNLRRLLEFVKSESSLDNYHYAILPSKSLANYNWDASIPHRYYEKVDAKEEHFRHRQEAVFDQLGVQVIWYPDGKHEEVPKILRRIADLDHQNNKTKIKSN